MADNKAGLFVLLLVRGDSFLRARTPRRCSALLPDSCTGRRYNIASIPWYAGFQRPNRERIYLQVVWRGWTEMGVADTLIVYASILYRG